MVFEPSGLMGNYCMVKIHVLIKVAIHSAPPIFALSLTKVQVGVGKGVKLVWWKLTSTFELENPKNEFLTFLLSLVFSALL